MIYDKHTLGKVLAKARFFDKGDDPPPPPDPVATANAQASANKQTAIAEKQMNLINQYTPFGNLEYVQRGFGADGTPMYSAYQTLSDNQQKIKDLRDKAGITFGQTTNNQLNTVRDRLSSPLSFDHLGPAPEINNEMRKEVADSMYARMNPQFDYDQDRLENQLMSRGLQRGSEAWNEGLFDFNRMKNDARLAVDSQSLDQAARMYGLEEGQRNARINELTMLRNQPLNELTAMVTGQQVQNPQFVNTPQTQINPADVMGATYASHNSAMDAWKQGQQSDMGFMGGLFGLGTGLLTAGAVPGGFLGFADPIKKGTRGR